MFRRDADDRRCRGWREIAEVMRDVASSQNLRTVSDSAHIFCVQSLKNYQDMHLQVRHDTSNIFKRIKKKL